MNRALLTKLHLAFAAFMFPAVVMFLLTGALYTWGNKGEWREDVSTVALEAPLASLDEAALKGVALAALEAQGLGEPSGKLSIETGPEASLSWNGARSEVAIAAAQAPASAEVTVREASLHRWLVQLHKAKGSTVFKVYSTLLAISLFLLVVSGLVMGLQVRALRGLTWAASAAGLGAFVAFVLLG